MTTGRCSDFDEVFGEPVEITRELAMRLAYNGMLLAYSPEHRELLRRENEAIARAAADEAAGAAAVSG